jgi:hypothetical protein
LSLNPTDYLKEFKGHIEGDADIKNTAAEMLSVLYQSKSPEMASQISSFGIGFGLSLLGQYLYIKKRGSYQARIISKILGAPVGESFPAYSNEHAQYSNL